MNHELAKTLTTALVQFIDEHRPEGTMCCSNEECESLEYHIRNNHHDDVEAFIQKKLSKLTEFEQFMDGVVDDTIRETYSEDGFKDICKDALNLAKKELARRDEVITLDNLPPYDKGFHDGKAEALKDLPRWKIWENGGCGNGNDIPIAIVRRGFKYELVSALGIQGEHYIMLSELEKLPGFKEGFNTYSGTSSANWQGNTSATDGKPHNPSFTD